MHSRPQIPTPLRARFPRRAPEGAPSGRRLIRAASAGFFGALLTLLTFLTPASPAQAARTIVVGFVDSAESGFYATTVQPTIEAIRLGIPGSVVETVRLSSVTIANDVRLRQPDLFIVPASDFLLVTDTLGAHAVATRKSTAAKAPSMSVGGVFVVRNDRADLTTVKSLRRKRAAATLPTALDGWLAARMALEEAGYDSQTFFKEVRFMTFGLPNVVSSVLSGAYDVGVLPTCMLERAEAEGIVARGALRVVGAVEDELLHCRRSTALYPDWVAGVLPTVDPELARELTIAILTPPKRDGSGTAQEQGAYVWQVTNDFHAVRELERRLHVGQWSYLDSWSLEALWRRFHWYVVAGLLILVAVVLNERRLRMLVRKRTAELQNALAERDRLEEAERAARLRLGELERMGAISQLCAMIAHELKQPVTSIINYVTVIKLRAGMVGGAAAPQASGTPGKPSAAPAPSADPVFEKAVDGVEAASKRIAGIVDRVRLYAKRERREPVAVDLCATLEAAASAQKKGAVAVRLLIPAKPVHVSGDPLELELLFLNLIKNAVEAAAGALNATPSRTPEVVVALACGGDAPEASSAAHDVRVTVTDNGPRLSDEAFERLMRVSESVKDEGLGLGLAIVRNIVDEHGARLTIRRRGDDGSPDADGLTVAVTFDLLDAPSAPKHSQPKDPS